MGHNAQLDSNNNFRIGYKKKIYSVSSEPYMFEMIPFCDAGNTEFRNYYASGKYQFYVSDGTHGNGNKLGLLINHDGNIGIGTTNPKAKLDVNGIIQFIKEFKWFQYCIMKIILEVKQKK